MCTSIQTAGLGSLMSNQVEHLNQDPTMHVVSLLCANEACYNAEMGVAKHRGKN